MCKNIKIVDTRKYRDKIKNIHLIRRIQLMMKS